MSHNNTQSGFTLVELLVTLGIFMVMTGVVLANYRTYNTGALFANASEDIVLALRQAQVYGVGSKGNLATCSKVDGLGNLVLTSPFECSYGVYFSLLSPNQFTVFIDVNDSIVFDDGDTVLETVVFNNQIKITDLECRPIWNPLYSPCIGDNVSVTFKRPTPDAIIRDGSVIGGSYFLKIIISDGSKYSTTTISGSGQISL